MDTTEWPPNRRVIQQAVEDALASSKWWIYRGESVKAVEQAFAASHDCAYGASVSNATVGLEVILKALGIGAGDEVVLPAYDFYSLPKIVLNVGAKPVFVDVCRFNPTIDAYQLAAVLSPNTKVVVAVHISGATAQIDTLSKMCQKAGVHLVEDCSQATGAKYAGRSVGSWGDAAVFSFGGVKLMTCGQGGMITTSDAQIYEKCYALCNRGMLPDGSINPYGIIGENFHISELAACVLLPQLDVLAAYCERRETVMNSLDQQITEIEGMKPVEHFAGASVRAQMSYGFYAIPSELNLSVEKFIEIAREEEIPMARAHNAVFSDPRLQDVFAEAVGFPAAKTTQESLIRIHHLEILRGHEHWKSSMENLARRLR